MVLTSRKPGDIRHLVFTHGHPDHIGSAISIIQVTGARTYMHAADVSMVESGGSFRPMKPAPGLIRNLMLRIVFDEKERTAPLRID